MVADDITRDVWGRNADLDKSLRQQVHPGKADIILAPIGDMDAEGLKRLALESLADFVSFHVEPHAETTVIMECLRAWDNPDRLPGFLPVVPRFECCRENYPLLAWL